MSFEYIYVKLTNDPHDIEVKVIDAAAALKSARKKARDAAIEIIGCDDILYGSGSGIYLGFKEIPNEHPRWWRKNPQKHDGYYVLIPLTKTNQHTEWCKIQEQYEESIGSHYKTTTIVLKYYPEMERQEEKPLGNGKFAIAWSAFGYVDGAQTVILGKIPITRGSKIEIPKDFTEITTGEFYGYLESHR